jgi:hypothetical protein
MSLVATSQISDKSNGINIQAGGCSPPRKVIFSSKVKQPHFQHCHHLVGLFRNTEFGQGEMAKV